MVSKKSASAASTPQKSTASTTATPSIPSANTRSVTTPSSSHSSKPSTSSRMPASKKSQSPQQIVQVIWSRYSAETPQRVKHIDAFLGFLMAVGAIQFVYCVLVGNYPFNAFLSGFSATVGQFVLTVSLRIQTDPGNAGEFGGKEGGFSDERAFADFVFGSLILHFFCVNFIN